MKKILLAVLVFTMALTSLKGFDYSARAQDAYQNNDIKRVSVHDPSVVKHNGKYYIFGSHMAYATSTDLINWTDGGSTMGGDETHSLLSAGGKSWRENCAKAFDWTTRYQKAFGRDDSSVEYGSWAPDVFYNKAMKKWCMYGCTSSWGSTGSVIFLATSDNIEGPYEFCDTMLYSGFSSYFKAGDTTVRSQINYTHTNLIEAIGMGELSRVKNSTTGWFDVNCYYNSAIGAYPNCIDPSVFTDKSGNMWMSYGSFFGGIYLVPLVEETGLVDFAYMKAHKNDGFDIYFGKQIISTSFENEGTGEGPYITYDSKTDYYYLYITYGILGYDGGYNIREYRSKNPDGPYYDKAGNKATDMKNTGVKLMGNYKLSCNKTEYLSGGHCSSIINSDGKMFMLYHTRFGTDNGYGHQVRVHQLLRSSDGWAVMLPYEYQGETVNQRGYSVAEITGTYEFVNHNNMTQRLESGAALSTIVLPTQKIELAADGTIYNLKSYTNSITNTAVSSKSVVGNWSKTDGTYYASFVIDGVKYDGAFCKQKDESANGVQVMTFTAIGTNNAEIWGVQTSNHTPSIKLTSTTPADKANGFTSGICTVCGGSASTPVYAIKTVALSQTDYVYNGKVRKPAVTVTDTSGKAIPSKYYKLTYQSGRKKVGRYKVTVSLSGLYKGTYNLYFNINPKPTTISSVSASSKGFTVKWKKQSTQTTGYQLQYSANSNFKSAKTITIKKNSTTSKKVTALKGKKKYYIRVRTYTDSGKNKLYSDWSKAKAVKTKK